jgi:hypothetical protein
MRSRCASLRLAGWGTVVFLVAGATAAAEVVETEMSVPGRIRYVTAVDLDGDSHADLVVLSLTGHSIDAVHHLSVFWQRPGSAFSEKPDTVWEVERGTVALDLSPTGGKSGVPADVYSLRADGVRAQRFSRTGVESRTVVKAALDHLVPGDQWTAVIDFVADWRGVGLEALVPEFPYPQLFPLGDKSNAGLALRTEPVATYWTSGSDKELRATTLNLLYSFPVPIATDQDGDGGPEIAFVERDRVTVFDAVATEKGGEALAKKVYPVRILSDAEVASDRFTVETRLVDLDGDKRADLLAVVYAEAGILELEGRVVVFLARADGSFAPTPDQEIVLAHALYSLTHVMDLDGDGSREIILPTADLGLWGYLRVLTTRKVSFDFNTLARSVGKGFDISAMARDDMTARLSKDHDLPVVKLQDMNGDGIVDVLIGSGEDRVCIFDGVRDPVHRFKSKPSTCFTADPYAIYTVVGLGGTERRDLVRYDPPGKDQGRLVLTVFRE